MHLLGSSLPLFPQLLLESFDFEFFEPAKAFGDGASTKTSPLNAITPKKLKNRRIPAPPLKSDILETGIRNQIRKARV
ncbi:MAG TPA: hypothetical protein VMF50_04740, partial [Candidatus Binataceae bacterium]|nr:hypothetical protein [Candidatus Binataceae bacterium]